MKPREIDDLELLPDTLRVYGKDVIGCKKYDRDIMISVLHSHGVNRSIQFNGKGFADIILTEEQAIQLVDDLAKIIDGKVDKDIEYKPSHS